MIPFLFSSIGASYVFLIFLLMMIFQLIFVVFSMPETKGKSLETLSNELIKKIMSKVVSFGEVLWDKLPSGKIPGGAPLNFGYRLNSFEKFSINY